MEPCPRQLKWPSIRPVAVIPPENCTESVSFTAKGYPHDSGTDRHRYDMGFSIPMTELAKLEAARETSELMLVLKKVACQV